MHGCSTGSRQTEADRRYVGTADWGNSSRVAYVRQPGSVAQQSSDVNAAKHSGRKTDAHTSPWTEHISGCQIRPRRLREVRVAEQEQPRQLVNAVDNQMDEPIRQGATVLLSCLLTHLNTALGRAPKCFNWFWFCCEHTLTAHLNIPWWANLKFYFLISVICLQSISAPRSQSVPRICMCCLLGLVGSSWHIHLSLLCVLEQNLIPESTLTRLF